MRNFLQNYFYYTRGERNGFILLLFLCVGFALAQGIITNLSTPSHIDDLVRVESSPKASLDSKIDAELFLFDPNTASKEDFIRLGLSSKTAESILKYRGDRTPFRQKSDFKKIYKLTEANYLRLAPYIEFEQKPTTYNTRRDIPRSYDNTSIPTRPRPSELFPFDPNTVSKEDLKRLGLSDRVVRTILKFRAKGSFRKGSDLSKIFGLSEADYQRLRPYINIPKPVFASAKTTLQPTINPTKDSSHKNYSYKKEQIDINLAEVEEWQLLSGIGPTYAKRIVEYRTALGGFLNIEQLNDIYGLPDSTLQKIRPQLSFSPVEIQQISINTGTSNELKKHPYLKWRQAQIIVNYRENHGSFEGVEDLKKIRAFDEALVEKLKPYLTVE